jgi:hypothetical protein
MEARDRAGHRLTATSEAAAAYNRGVEALLQLRSGAVRALATSIVLDPTFAMGHAAMALLGHEMCVPVDVAARLAAARGLTGRTTARERSHVAAVAGHLAGDRTALVHHLEDFPDDALLLSVAVPTIAFAGVTQAAPDGWRIVESCAPAYGDDWYFTGLLAFVRQEQRHWEESMDLAVRSLGAMPSAGHAAHARAHVHYETADHGAGVDWLDGWIGGPGAETDNLAHFCWHAALHELSEGDLGAVARRYAAQLSPAHVHGARSLVDTGSLVWRWAITPGAREVPAVRDALDVEPQTLTSPPTPFMGLHAAIVLGAADDAQGLRRLARWAAGQRDPVQREVVAPLAEAVRLLVIGQPSRCADRLRMLLPELPRVGGSDAQREVVEETLLVALMRAGRHEEACTLVDRRLDRRRCRRDEWFRELADVPVP